LEGYIVKEILRPFWILISAKRKKLTKREWLNKMFIRKEKDLIILFYCLSSNKIMLFKSFELFGDSSFTPLNQSENFLKTVSFFMKWYCLTTFFIFLLILHRLFLQKVFGRSLDDVKFGL